MTKSDQELITAYHSGDELAINDLIQRHLRPVYNFVYRLVGGTNETEDITQEVFLKMWQNLGKYNIEQNFKTWLFTIAHNAAIDWLRRKKNINFSQFENADGENVLLDNLVDPEPLPDAVLARADEDKFVAAALNNLAPIYREVLLLYYVEQLTLAEVSQILKKPLDTIKSQHRRALILLRKSLVAPK